MNGTRILPTGSQEAMVLALHPNMVISHRIRRGNYILRLPSTAEFRGPGVRHRFDDSDDYEAEVDQRSSGIGGGRSGRIILLGDGTEVLTDSDETEMFDHEEEDKDLDSQVGKGGPQTEESRARSEREETPGPQPQPSKEQVSPTSNKSENPFDTPPPSTPDTILSADSAKEPVKALSNSAIPEKLVSPAKS